MSVASYLDYNATAPVLPAAIDAVAQCLRAPGNASSIHRFGRAQRRRIEEARAALARAINAQPAEIVFTSGGTEANALALNGSGRKRLIVSAIEHDSVLRNAGDDAARIPVDSNGVVDVVALRKILAGSAEPALVAVMLANNETGVIQPLAEIVRVAQEYGALVLCDAVQALGKIAVDFAALGVDYLSLSAHKIGGLQGAGALVVRKGAPVAAQLLGGGQEASRRAGTENLPGIVAFGVAAGQVCDHLSKASFVAGLRDQAARRIKDLAPAAQVFGHGASRLPNTLCIEMPGVKAETQIVALDLAGVAVSAGAACSSGKLRPSTVLQAMGVDAALAGNAIRISFGWDSDESDVERLIAGWGALWARAGERRPVCGTAA
jgi:cysteine desulfurase